VTVSLDSITGAAEAAVAAIAIAMPRLLINLILVDCIGLLSWEFVSGLGDKSARLLNDLRERQR